MFGPSLSIHSLSLNPRFSEINTSHVVIANIGNPSPIMQHIMHFAAYDNPTALHIHSQSLRTTAANLSSRSDPAKTIHHAVFNLQICVGLGRVKPPLIMNHTYPTLFDVYDDNRIAALRENFSSIVKTRGVESGLICKRGCQYF